ncbi:TIGR00730 family Rossman fold protein [Candidatus Kaiserbacteria bacterium CG10_big_fil_rev_8_21_14_0_10_56_12]|uniref:Cytokinin riboside 5'-monophosphate phosphoribohydrolase n=1 Tax=Candidatus Kaiserbacteria bacterium CG10_big_fil_rev_8_21_14_0_10_56_12 TaxID=1974611 RepID=A0A2H0UAF9_9BACT|nr:MAG: TIGR00730 family Rossman fold protein [Candidatus Kaiserbacteria bacterium CG10_big_fil_rev_8_21_14_0_10_56_12]
MAELLAKSIHEGQRAVPQEHKPLVCKPRVMESWRIFRIMSEFVEGFDILRKYGLAATFFGSARLAPTDPEYKVAQDLAARLSEKGLAIITGGSAGVMRAANQGAFEKGGASVGLNIDLPSKQRDNPFLTESYNFYHFFVRKVMLTYASEVYVYFPGGYGTMDEFFEIITLVQTGKIRRVPIVLIERSYWEPLINFMKKSMLEERGAIDEEDLELYTIVDTVDEAFDYIVANVTC